MMGKARVAACCALVVSLFALGTAYAQRQTPYWASIDAGKALMRTGPGRTYPATWLYLRRDLPIKVLAVHEDWRRVQDPGGEIGWMQVRLLTDRRSGIVLGEAPQDMREGPSPTSPVRFRAEPGVVGRVSRCANGWCLFDVAGRRGYIRTEALWGVDATETIE